MNDTIYYFSDVPLPFIVSQSGRDIIIPTVDLSLNGTSFQCFNPGNDVISSSIGVLTVTGDGMYDTHIAVSSILITVTVARVGLGHFQTPDNYHYCHTKLVLDHQRFLFTHDSITLAWRTLKFNNETRVYYQLMATSSCSPNSISEVLMNRTTSESIVLQPGDLVDERNRSLHLNITSMDKGGIPCLVLETFQVKPQREFY